MSRKIIDKVEYLKTQSALEKRLAQTPQLELVPGVHNVNLIPEGLNIHYISKQYMNDFKPFAPYDIRTHKLVVATKEKSKISHDFRRIFRVG